MLVKTVLLTLLIMMITLALIGFIDYIFNKYIRK